MTAPPLRGMLVLALVGVSCAAAWSDVPAGGLLSNLDRAVYDARMGGMGGAGLAVPGSLSAPVDNPAMLGVDKAKLLSASYFGNASPAGPIGARDYFSQGTPRFPMTPSYLRRALGWTSPAGRDTSGELSVLGVARADRFALFGTKYAVAAARMTSVPTAGTVGLSVDGEGIEYESMGGAYGFPLGHRTWVGFCAKEIRFYRGLIAETAHEEPSGDVAIVPHGTSIVRGLTWSGDVGVYHQGHDRWSYAAVVRHVNAPRFAPLDRSVEWTLDPSLDVGAAYARSEGRDLFAADVRGLFSTHTPRPVLRLGWEHALSDAADPWRVRLGLRDGRPTAGIGWTSSHGRIDLAFGPNPSQTAALTTTVEF